MVYSTSYVIRQAQQEVHQDLLGHRVRPCNRFDDSSLYTTRLLRGGIGTKTAPRRFFDFLSTLGTVEVMSERRRYIGGLGSLALGMVLAADLKASAYDKGRDTLLGDGFEFVQLAGAVGAVFVALWFFGEKDEDDKGGGWRGPRGPACSSRRTA